MDIKKTSASFFRSKGSALLVGAITLAVGIGLVLAYQIRLTKTDTLASISVTPGENLAKQAAYGALVGGSGWLTALSSAPATANCTTNTSACTGNQVYSSTALSGGASAQSSGTWATIGRTDDIASNCGVAASAGTVSCAWVIQRSSCNAATGSSVFTVTAMGVHGSSSSFLTKTLTKTWTGSVGSPGIFYDQLANSNCGNFNCTTNSGYCPSCGQNTVGSPPLTLNSSSTGQTLSFSSGQAGIITGVNLIQPIYYNASGSNPVNPGTATTMCGAVQYTVKLTNITQNSSQTYTGLSPTDLGVNVTNQLGAQYTCSNITGFTSSSTNYAGPLGNGVAIPSVFTASAAYGIPLSGGTSFSAIPSSAFTVNYGDQIYVTATVSTTYNAWDVPNGSYGNQSYGCGSGNLWCNVPFRIIGVISNYCP